MIAAFIKKAEKNRAVAAFRQLQRRERLFLIAGAVFLLCFFAIVLVVQPYLEGRRALESGVAGKRRDLNEISQLQREYRRLLVRRNVISHQLSRRDASFSLFSYLERRAAAAAVKDRITSMKPSTAEPSGGIRESSVELHLKELTIEELVGFLATVESVEEVVVVRRLTIEQNSKNRNLLDISMTVCTFENSSPQGALSRRGIPGIPVTQSS